MAIKFGRPLESRVRFAPIEPTSTERRDLTIRPRRNRRTAWARRLVREHVLTRDDLIWPLFVVEGSQPATPVEAMPGVFRLSIEEVIRQAERAVALSIPVIALFPYTDPLLQDESGSEATRRTT